jgi:hypothetical protein
MGDKNQPVAQWTLDVTVYHATGFRHVITAQVLTKRRGWQQIGSWSWTTLGVPADLVPDIEARVCSAITEHLVTAYGVQGTLDVRPGG